MDNADGTYALDGAADDLGGGTAWTMMTIMTRTLAANDPGGGVVWIMIMTRTLVIALLMILEAARYGRCQWHKCSLLTILVVAWHG